MKIYDYLDRQREIEVRDGINFILVNVISGDETGKIVYNDGTEQEFDASSSRVMGFFDGNYIVRGKNVDEFINFIPDDSNSIGAAYQRQSKFS